VSVYDRGALLRTAPLDGVTTDPSRIVSLAVRTLSVGTHTLTAVYTGDATYEAATSSPFYLTVTGGTFPAGDGADRVAFDGTSIWVLASHNHVSTVNKIRVAHGAMLGSFAVGSAPVGIAFDGTHVWVSNYNGGR